MPLARQDGFPVFEPSLASAMLSYLTAPITIGSVLGMSVAVFAGISVPSCFVSGLFIISAQHIFLQIISGGKTLRASVFNQADHLSRLDLQGGLLTITVPPLIETLSQLDCPNAKKLRNALQSMLNYDNHFDYLGINNHLLLQDLSASLSELETGEIVAFPLSCLNPISGGHIIIGSVEREQTPADHIPSYILRIFNGGIGLKYHRYRIEKESGRRLYQTTMEISGVPLTQLNVFLKKAALLHAFRLNNHVDQLYKLLETLEGHLLPPHPDDRFWMRVQQGNSCSGYSVKCFIKTILSEKEYLQFQTMFLSHSVNNLQKGLQTGWFYEKTYQHQMAHFELSQKLNRYAGFYSNSNMNTQQTPLSQLASETQRVFWSFLFPLTFSSMKSNQLGYDVDDGAFLGELKLFQDLDKVLQSFKEAYHGDPQASKEILKHQVDLLSKAFQNFYTRLNLKPFSSLERHYLKEAYDQITQPDGYDTIMRHAYRFYLIAFIPVERTLNDEGAQQLINIKRYLNENCFEDARHLLNHVYQLTHDGTCELTPEQRDEYYYVLCKMLYSINFKEAVILEDIELRAGIAALFANLSFKLPYYLKKNLDLYQNLRLDKAFAKSRWYSLINQHHVDKSQPLDESVHESYCFKKT